MDSILFILLLPLALMVLYLDVLSVAALVRRRGPQPVPARYRFAILVPAHNEEARLPRLLDSITTGDYPRSLFDIHVVADNCTDATAPLARHGGAIVHERTDELRRGKGYALQWLIERIGVSGQRYDAYVVLDADSIVSPNLLSVLNDHLTRGDEAVQCYDGVLNRDESWVSSLSYVALALFNNLRPRGRDALGLSVGLRGNGMCFTSALIDRFGWRMFGLAEDHAYHVQLVSAGIRVRYAPSASVLAEQPTSLQQAYSQSLRWERGRFQLISGRLLVEAVRRRDPAPLDTFAEQIVPPFSLLTGLIGAGFLCAAVLGATVPLLLASGLILGETFYVLVGLRLVRARTRVYLGLLAAPLYIAWKIWVILVAALPTGSATWVRTARVQEDV